MKVAPVLSAAVLLAAVGQPCWGQFIRPPVVVPRVPVHVPFHPHFPGIHQGPGAQDDTWIWAACGLAALFGVGWLIHSRRKQSRPSAAIRIIAAPPGEAPEFVRQAWVGLALPVVAGQSEAANLTAQQVLSGRSVGAPLSYAVDGPAAIAILNAASPKAAAWWRQNAPEALVAGYQLVFPAEVCERADEFVTVDACS